MQKDNKVELFAEEQTEVAARGEKAAVRWLRILQGIRRKVDSIAANGGIVSMTASWSPKRVESLLKELEQLETKLQNIEEELKNEN
jgi:predicted nuclease with TOPRIM domain